MYSNKKYLDKPYCRITAPAKAILCGEHAVVYGEDAIALAIGLHCIAQIGNMDKQHEEARIYIYLADEEKMIQLNWRLLKEIAKDN
jgi:mevalonate kinase